MTIKEAMQRLINGRHVGLVLATGYLQECYCDESSSCSLCKNVKKYMILSIKANGNETIETFIDDNGSVRFAEGIKERDVVVLNILDNFCAMWKKNGDMDIAWGNAKYKG